MSLISWLNLALDSELDCEVESVQEGVRTIPADSKNSLPELLNDPLKLLDSRFRLKKPVAWILNSVIVSALVCPPKKESLNQLLKQLTIM